VLGATSANCSLQFQAGEYYCIGVSSTTIATTTTQTLMTKTTGGTPVTTPSPTQTGIDPKCTRYAEAQSGDNCSNFAASNGISTDQLYGWNSILGANGVNCNTQFWAKEYYCIGVSADGAGSSTRASSVTAPGPTQSGIASNCNRFLQARSGDTCSTFAQNSSITTAQLYAWNPVLKNDGSDCSTQFWAGEWYCVGAST
jgi:hypothetical protein